MMKRFIAYSVLLIAVVFATSFFTLNANQVSSDEDPRVIAMYIYADWCGACQAIKPIMEEAKPEFEEQPVLFVKMDMTNDFTAHQSKLMAARLGLSEIFEKNEGMTGFVLLLDANTNEVLDKITTDDDKQGIITKITNALE
jgi:thiol-disulfide isomerase/thioredoxin